MTALLGSTRVIDLGGEALSYGGRALADLGADVILIEPPGGGANRSATPSFQLQSGRSLSARFAYTSAGKRAVTLDLSREQGRDIFWRLLATADVLLSTSPAGEISLLEVTVREICDRFPTLILASVTPFGVEGTRRHWRGSDLTGWATSGVLSLMGDPDRAPLVPRDHLAYIAASMNAVMGVVMALEGRHANSRGQLVDVSVQEALLGMEMGEGPASTWDSLSASTTSVSRKRTSSVGQYRVRNGSVMIVTSTPWHWDLLVAWISEEIENSDILNERYRGSPQNRAPYKVQLDAIIEAFTMRYDKQAFMEEAQRRGIPATALNSAPDILTDPHLEATGGWTTVSGPESLQVRLPRPALIVNDVALETGRIPEVGQHNGEILAEELGLGWDGLEVLRITGVV